MYLPKEQSIDKNYLIFSKYQRPLIDIFVNKRKKCIDKQEYNVNHRFDACVINYI